MKQKNWIYVLAFLAGVILVNLVEDVTEVSNSILNRYNLMRLTFDEIIFEKYLVEILFLRLRTVIILWILTQTMPKRIVSVGFALLISGVLGGIAATSILTNGLWGILLLVCVLFPHGICYGIAYVLWSNYKVEYLKVQNRTEVYIVNLLIVIFVCIGCLMEAYIGPVLIKNIIKC
ncbi:MAG: hypothetical protein IKU69_00995 [Roseburia sp.]|nr:hypothetical protein [Roseburia sp.]